MKFYVLAAAALFASACTRSLDPKVIDEFRAKATARFAALEVVAKQGAAMPPLTEDSPSIELGDANFVNNVLDKTRPAPTAVFLVPEQLKWGQSWDHGFDL